MLDFYCEDSSGMAGLMDGGRPDAAQEMPALAQLRETAESLWGKLQELDGCRSHLRAITQLAEVQAAQYSGTSVAHLETQLAELKEDLVEAKIEEILLQSLETGRFEVDIPLGSQESSYEEGPMPDVAQLAKEMEDAIAAISSGWEQFENEQQHLHGILSSCDQKIANLEELYEQLELSTGANQQYQCAARRLEEIRARSLKIDTEIEDEDRQILLANAELEEGSRELAAMLLHQQKLDTIAETRERCTLALKHRAMYSGITLTDFSDKCVKLNAKIHKPPSTENVKDHMQGTFSAEHSLEIILDPLSMELRDAQIVPDDVSISDLISGAKQASVRSYRLSRLGGKRNKTLSQVEYMVNEVCERIYLHGMKTAAVSRASESSRYDFRLIEHSYISATILGNMETLLEAPPNWPMPGFPLSLSSLLPDHNSANEILERSNSLSESLRCDLVRFVEAVENIVANMN